MKMGRQSLAFGRWPLVVGSGQNPATDLHGFTRTRQDRNWRACGKLWPHAFADDRWL